MVNTTPFAPFCIAPDLDSGLAELDLCLRRLYLPICSADGLPNILAADNSPENISWLHSAYPHASVFEVSKPRLLAEFSHRFAARIADEAVNGLARSSPSLSARTVMTGAQALSFGMIASIAVAASLIWPNNACGVLAGLLSVGFVGGTLFRAALAWIGGRQRYASSSLTNDDVSLPVYTILVPLYQEANVLPRLIRSLLLLDYPHDKLDIKLIVESDDTETAVAADAMQECGPFEVVRVPVGTPRTKPRACNYAFKFTRGEFTVIYDAEDRPERDQLRKAVEMFRTGPRDIACLQARLNFYNANENWLTRGIMAQTPPTAGQQWCCQ